LRSVLRQTFQDFEVLVIGDGCTDDSGAVVQAIGDPRVRWTNLPHNSGHQSTPNNEGLRQARGEFIAYLGHDDLWLPNHLGCHVQALDGGADLTHSVTMMIGAGEHETQACAPGAPYVPGCWLPPSAVVHRRRVSEAVGGWADYGSLRNVPEIDIWRRVHDAGYRIVFVPRLTAVKFPATWRRDVYVERPCHEQASWLERIEAEEDFEPVELAGMLADALRTGARWDEQPFAAFCRGLLREMARRIRRLVGLRGYTVRRYREGKGLTTRRDHGVRDATGSS